MCKRWLAVLALVAALGLVTPMVSADQGKAKGKGNPHANKSFDEDDDDQGWQRRGGYEIRIYSDRDGHPPGWSRGKKTGWGNCGLPPGQAKKYGCRTYVFERRRYYYYHDDDGRIVVRRPRIDVHAVIQ